MLHQDIKDELKKAMIAKDATKVSVIRGLIAGFMNELVAKKIKPDEMLSDEDALSVIRRQAKQRKDSIDQFKAGGREDLAEKEQAELNILDSYLPQMMSRDEIKKIAEAKIAELGITDKTKAGILTGNLMKDLKGKADGADVKAVIDELLA